MHCNLRKRVKLCGLNMVGRTVNVWIGTTMVSRELNRLDGRVSTSLDLSNTVSHSFRQLMDIIWNLNTCFELLMKSLRDKNRFTKDQQHLNFVENHTFYQNVIDFTNNRRNSPVESLDVLHSRAYPRGVESRV